MANAVEYSTLFRTPVRTADATAPTGTTTAASGSKNMADYQTFLKLLVTQMKTQDPTNPMDATQQVAQLATFSQVEQSIQMNAKLETILQTSSLSQADAIIGRTVTSADGKASGVVKEVKLYSDGISAILADGTEIPILPGTKIS